MIKKINNEIFYLNQKLPILSKKLINFLIKKTLKNKSKNVDFVYKNRKDKLHEMFVVHTKKYSVQPHYHLNKSESLLFYMDLQINYF